MIYCVKDIEFSYGSETRRVLDSVSLSLSSGEIMSVLGPNGAGKSTLLECMAALLKPQGGSIELTGKDIFSMKPREIADIVGYVPQNHAAAFDYTVLEFVLMGRASKMKLFERPTAGDREIAERAISDMGLTHLSNKSYMQISGGERQQAMIARALAQEPKVLLFDEPTAHLDYGNQLKTLKIIKGLSKKGYAVVMTTHNPDHAVLLGGSVAMLSRDGRLECGRTKEILTEEMLQRVYGTEIKLVYVDEVHRTVCTSPDID